MAKESTVKAATPVAPAPEAAKEVKPVEKASYFRIKKLSTHLFQILEVEVDESQISPKAVGVPDLKVLTLDKIQNYICPHPDFKRKK